MEKSGTEIIRLESIQNESIQNEDNFGISETEIYTTIRAQNGGQSSSTTIPFIHATFGTLSKLWLLPYDWDPFTKVLIPRFKKWERLYWITTILGLSWFNLAFVTWQLCKNFYTVAYEENNKKDDFREKHTVAGSGAVAVAGTGNNSPNYGELNIQIFVFILSALYAVFQYNLYDKTAEVADFYSQIESYRQSLINEKGNLVPNDFLVVHLVTIMILVCNLGQVGAAIIFPHRPQFIYSVLPPSFQCPILHGIFLMYNFHLTCSSIASSLILVFGVFLYIETTNTGMSMSMEKAKVIKPTPTDTFNELLNYRRWQLLSNRFNDCFARITVPIIIWCLVMTGVTCSFGSIRFIGKLSVFEYVILPPPVLCVLVFLVYLIVPAAKIQENSELKRWLWILSSTRLGSQLRSPSRSDKNFTRICVRSCADIHIKVVNWFCISKTTFISLASFIVCQTISMLLYFPS